MKFKIKKSYIRQPINIYILLFLKPIFDMFYQYSIFDYIILSLAILIFIKYIIKGKKIQFNIVDIIVSSIIILYTISLLNEVTMYTVRTYIKIISSFVIFYIGRLESDNTEELFSAIRSGLKITLLVDIIYLISGHGMTQWGTARTYIGLYYYKTDLAVALITLIIFVLAQKTISIIDYFYVMVATTFVFLTNSRMSWLMLILSVVFLIEYWREKKQKIKPIKISFKVSIIILIVGIFTIYMLQYLGNTAMFKSLGFISLDFENLSDLFSDSNMQGRNNIWIQILQYFNSMTIMQKMFGISINSNVASIMNAQAVSAHNLYIGILYATGFVGLILTIAHTICSLKVLNNLKDRSLFYVTFLLMCCYYIFGISCNTNEFTNYSWIFMFCLGMAFQKRHNI